MMNLLALCLVVTSLATSGLWSPNPERESNDVIVKEGHRTVVVEFEQEGDGNTKVLISPHDGPHIYDSTTGEKLSDAARTAKERMKEASSVPPNVGQGHSGNSHPPNGHGGHSARELVCDALGKCKHKIASAIGKTREKVSEVEEEAKEAVGEALGKAKETVSRKAHEVSDKAGEVKEKAKETVSDKAHEVSDKAREVGEKAKETASRKSHEVSDKAREVGEKAKETVTEKAHDVKKGAKEAVDLSKTIGNYVKRNVTQTTDAVMGQVEEKAEESVNRLKAEGQKTDLSDILRRGREVVHDVTIYLVCSNSYSWLMSVIHLLEFGTAYGMCVWVTFISSYVLADALPRQQFGMVHSKIYPVYFRAMAYCVGAVLLSHLLSQRKRLFHSIADTFQAYNLLASLSMILANLLYLEPMATKVMFERMKLEKDEGRGGDDDVTRPGSMVADHVGDPAPKTGERPQEEREKSSRVPALSLRLKKLNNFSSFLNILTLMGLSWHLVYLGQRLHLAH